MKNMWKQARWAKIQRPLTHSAEGRKHMVAYSYLAKAKIIVKLNRQKKWEEYCIILSRH